LIEVAGLGGVFVLRRDRLGGFIGRLAEQR
jgi:hypothetical protein